MRFFRNFPTSEVILVEIPDPVYYLWGGGCTIYCVCFLTVSNAETAQIISLTINLFYILSHHKLQVYALCLHVV